MKSGTAIGKYFPLLLLTISNFSGFSQSPTAPAAPIWKVDTTIYVMLPYDSSAMMAMNWRYTNARRASLTRLEVDDLESIVDSAYLSYTKDSTVYLHDLFPLSIYRRQYVAVITEKGEKEVWVNFICGDYGHWRNSPVFVDDGGKCYFQLFINLTRRRAYDLIPGGAA
jgi:hypothetical protein